MASRSDLTIYHDGSCPLCRMEIDHYRRQTGAERLTFVDVSDPNCVPGCDLDARSAMARFHVRDGDGRLLSGAAGFAAVWSRLPRYRWASRLAALPGALFVLEMGYRASGPIRRRIARLIRMVRR